MVRDTKLIISDTAYVRMVARVLNVICFQYM